MPRQNIVSEDCGDIGIRYPVPHHEAGGVALIGEKHGPRETAYFDIYCAEWVSFTSVHSGGGDWHWRLISAGLVLLDCGGYKSRAACIQAVEILRREAWAAEFTPPEFTPPEFTPPEFPR